MTAAILLTASAVALSALWLARTVRRSPYEAMKRGTRLVNRERH